MGQNAVYISVDDRTLDALWSLDDEPFRERFLEIEEDQNFSRLDIAKIWDALHCTLTGVSASKPIEGNKLSEAIVGVHPKIYDDDDYSVFVSAIDVCEITEILLALEAIDLPTLTSKLDPVSLKKQDIYPEGIWHDDESRLAAEMDAALSSIRQFFQCSLQNGKHVLASIF